MTQAKNLFLILLCLATFAAPAADYEKGMEAYQRGDYATALREFKPLAEQGDAEAQNTLGVMYSEGQGVAQDDQIAMKWIRRAAEQGDAVAQNNLGSMYFKGQGVPQDYQMAAKWWQLAAEQGYAGAQYNLGVMYERGEGVLQDYVQAHMWYNIAAVKDLDLAAKNRNRVAEKMTPADVATAQQLARERME